MFSTECAEFAGRLKAEDGVTVVLNSTIMEVYTDTWRVVWYESPTGHRFASLKGDGDTAIQFLGGRVPSGYLELVNEKWRWCNEHVMFKQGWGKVSRRDAQRGVDKPEEPVVQPKLVFGGPMPEGTKKKRRVKK